MILGTPGYGVGFVNAAMAGVSEAPWQWYGPVGLYVPFLGNQGDQLYDLSGLSHHGVLTNFTLSSAWGIDQRGASLQFDGSSTHVNIGPHADFYFNLTKPFSVTAWFKLSGGAGTLRRIANRWNGGVAGNWYFGITETNVLHVHREVSPWTGLSGTTTLSVGQIYHGAFVYDSVNLNVYLNGVADATPVASDNIPDDQSGIDVVIGAAQQSGSPTAVFPGLLDDIRIYNRALSAAEVMDIYRDPFAMYRLRSMDVPRVPAAALGVSVGSMQLAGVGL